MQRRRSDFPYGRRNVQLRKRRAAVERTRPKLAQRIGQRDLRQGGAVRKGAVADLGYAAAERDALQTHTVGKGSVFHRQNALGQRNRLQRHGVLKRALSDLGHACGNRYGGQRAAVAEGVFADGGHAFGKNDAFERRTGVKQMRGDRLDAAGQHGLFQTLASPEDARRKRDRIRQHDFLQRLAVAERVRADPDFLRSARDLDGTQRRAVEKRIVADRSQTLAERNRFQFRTVCERILRQDCHAGKRNRFEGCAHRRESGSGRAHVLGQVQRLQRRTAIKSVFADFGQAFRQVYFGEPCTTEKRRVSDFFNALVQRDALQGFAFVKCVFADASHAFGQGDARKAAVSKRVVRYARHAVRQDDLRGGFAEAGDIFHARRNTHRRFVAVIPKQYAVAGDNEFVGQRFKIRGALERPAADLAHAGRNRKRFQRRARAERLRADASQAVRQSEGGNRAAEKGALADGNRRFAQRYALERFAAGKCAVGDFCHARGERDAFQRPALAKRRLADAAETVGQHNAFERLYAQKRTLSDFSHPLGQHDALYRHLRTAVLAVKCAGNIPHAVGQHDLAAVAVVADEHAVTDNNELVGLRVEIGRLVKRIRPDALHAFGDGDVRNTGAVKRLGSDFLDAVGQLDCPQAAAVDKRTAGDRPYAVGQRDRTERICVRKGIFSDLRHRRAAQHAGHDDVSFRAGIGDQPRFAVAQVKRKAALRLYDARFGCAVFGRCSVRRLAGGQAQREQCGQHPSGKTFCGAFHFVYAPSLRKFAVVVKTRVLFVCCNTMQVCFFRRPARRVGPLGYDERTRVVL